MRLKIFILLIAIASIVPSLLACVDVEMVDVYGFYWVSVCDSSGCGGHWQYGLIGWYNQCNGYAGDSGGGGGSSGTSSSTAINDLRTRYSQNGCSPVPDANQFLDETGYDASGMQDYFPFADWKDSGSSYVLVDGPLVPAIASMDNCMGHQLPGLSDPGNGAGYRVPGAHTTTDPCSSHAQGESVDLSTRDSSGGHSCQLWNALAACAHAAGLYVEPWSMIQESGVIHMHVTTDSAANSPAEYGDACAN